VSAVTSRAAEDGTTLVEVLIATFVLAVALAALSSAIPFAAYGTQEGAQLSTAAFLANQRLEQVRGARWQDGPPAIDDLGVSSGPAAAPAIGARVTFADEPALGAPFGDYARSVRVTDCSGGGTCGGIAKPDLRQVVVTVSYRPMTGVGLAASGTAKTATVATFVAKR